MELMSNDMHDWLKKIDIRPNSRENLKDIFKENKIFSLGSVIQIQNQVEALKNMCGGANLSFGERSRVLIAIKNLKTSEPTSEMEKWLSQLNFRAPVKELLMGPEFGFNDPSELLFYLTSQKDLDEMYRDSGMNSDEMALFLKAINSLQDGGEKV